MDTSKSQSLLVDELANVIDTLHGLFDEIGLTRYERENQESTVYAAISAALHEQLRLVSEEKSKLVEECRQLIFQTKQMERSLSDSDVEHDHDEDEDQITAPLSKCLQSLKEKHKLVKRRHAERYESIKKLVHALNTYASRLESSIIQIPLPPDTSDSTSIVNFDLSHSYYERLEQEFNRVYQEFTRRVSTVKTLAKEIVNLYAELGIPSAQIDRSIVEYGSTEPERLGLAKDDLERLRSKRSKLFEERERRKEKMERLRTEVGELWIKLGVEQRVQKTFLAQHRGCDVRCIQELEDELQRLLDLKRANLGAFIQNARQSLQELWDQLYFSEDEILEFSSAQSDVYTDALLSAHEMEIVRLQSLLEERAPILNLINKHRELMNDKEQLAISSNDSSRLMARGGGMARDPTRLLREEKLRKRIAKELPRVEVELKKSLEKWEDENGSPMVVNGENYLETLMRVSPVAQSRAATKTPTNTTRPRANTTSSTPHLRGRSKSSIQEMAQKPPVRSKTPAARPKTPSGGQLWSGSAATVGRYDGRSLAATIDRAGSRTPGFGVGRIPQPVGNHASPTRNGRPPLCTFPSGANSPERKETQAPAMLERSSSIVKSKISVFNALGNIPTMHPQRPDPEKQMIPFMRHQMHQNRQDNQQRLSNSTNRSIRSVSPYGDSDANYSGYCDEDGMGGVPNVDTYGRNSYEYDSSVRGSETSASDGRKFSLSTASTLSTLETSGSENWEAFGEDSDGGDEPRTAYPQKSQRGYSVSSGKSVGLVRNAVPSQWNSESAY